MSKIQSTIDQIDASVLKYAPAVIVGIQAAQITAAAGADKKQAVIDGILVGAKVAEGSTDQNVAAIGGMIDLFVSIFKALKVPGFSQ